MAIGVIRPWTHFTENEILSYPFAADQTVSLAGGFVHAFVTIPGDKIRDEEDLVSVGKDHLTSFEYENSSFE